MAINKIEATLKNVLKKAIIQDFGLVIKGKINAIF